MACMRWTLSGRIILCIQVLVWDKFGVCDPHLRSFRGEVSKNVWIQDVLDLSERLDQVCTIWFQNLV